MFNRHCYCYTFSHTPNGYASPEILNQVFHVNYMNMSLLWAKPLSFLPWCGLLVMRHKQYRI